MKKMILLLSFTLFFSATASSEPNAAVRFLMNSHPSMLDWGLYKIEQSFDLNVFGEKNLRNGYAMATYNARSDHLVISYIGYVAATQDTSQLCGRMMRSAKLALGVDPKTVHRVTEHTSLAWFFHHSAETSKHVPKTLDTDIERITDLHIDLLSSKNGSPPFVENTGCQSALLGRSVRYTDDVISASTDVSAPTK